MTYAKIREQQNIAFNSHGMKDTMKSVNSFNILVNRFICYFVAHWDPRDQTFTRK